MAIHPFGDWIKKLRQPWRAPAIDGFRLWRADRGEKLRMDFSSLAPGALVLDIGGFAGDWAQQVLEAAPSVMLHVVEPHPRFAAKLRRRFREFPNVKIHEFALAGSDGEIFLSDEGDASSIFPDRAGSIVVRTCGIDKFFSEIGATQVAFAKINIEAAEYELIPHLVQGHHIGRIEKIHVQFHLFTPEHKKMREECRSLLSLTHHCDWAYPFVWEQWTLR
ncbi:MAG: FkbM family methyltransferase [Rhodobacteraceae bacterium]|nr:FkbM family methyltransferase [Paracoccaceae bacterium]